MYKMAEIIDLSRIELHSFEWDKGNSDKNWERHAVTNEEAEQPFFNEPILIFEDAVHSKNEKRLVAYGRSDEGKLLTVIFTVRQGKIRVISARNQSKKERKIYEKS